MYLALGITARVYPSVVNCDTRNLSEEKRERRERGREGEREGRWSPEAFSQRWEEPEDSL